MRIEIQSIAKKARRALWLWLPPVAIVAAIYLLSDQPDLSTGLGVWDMVGRKLAHIAEFGLLTAAWYRASRGRVAISVAISLLYAIADEVHQGFVAGRSSSPLDVGVDAVGILIAVLLIKRRAVLN